MDVTSVSNAAPAVAAISESANGNWMAENRDLIQSVKAINATELFGANSELSFALDRDTKRPVVRVVNSQTGEVLWQTPPEYMLRLAQTLGKLDG